MSGKGQSVSHRDSPQNPSYPCFRIHKRVTMRTMDWFKSDRVRYAALAAAWVVPEPSRCVQCGICSFHCPMGIDVRRHVWRAEPVKDGRLPNLRRVREALSPRTAPLRADHGRGNRPSEPRRPLVTRRHVLIGTGPSAISAAETIRSRDDRALRSSSSAPSPTGTTRARVSPTTWRRRCRSGDCFLSRRRTLPV